MLQNEDIDSVTLTLSHLVIGAAIEVHRVLGPGLLESVYEAALCRELSLRGIQYNRQKRIPVVYKGQLLDCDLKLDLLIEDALILEIKVVERLLPVHRSQVLTYLRLQGLRLGLLINFNSPLLRDGIRRILNG